MYRTASFLFMLSMSWNVAGGAEFDWTLWQALPVQNGGRQKPLDTLSRETLRLLSNRSSFADPGNQQKLGPTAVYLSMLFDWKGAEHPDKHYLQTVTDWRGLYSHLHQFDKWDRAPLLRVDFLPLRESLGMAKDQKYISPAELTRAELPDPQSQRMLPFSKWAQRISRREAAHDKLTVFEEKGLELGSRLWGYQNHRMGAELEIAPVRNSEDLHWVPITHLLLTSFDDASDPTGSLRRIQSLLRTACNAYRAGDAAAFNQNASELVTALRAYGEHVGNYPDKSLIDLEVSYNRWAPFRIAWVLMLFASLAMLLFLGSGWRVLQIGAYCSYSGGIVALLAGFGVRIAISGRPPVTNMYESVIYVGSGVAILGLIFEILYRKRFIFLAAATTATISLLVADNCPLVLDPSFHPLEPVLRSNLWLIVHVMTITLSYAAFALALGIANITLGYYLVDSNDRSTIHSLSRFTYKALQVGVLLLAAGTILGGIWADYSWGRFWGWDPKEVWALIALLGYLAVLHARKIGWVGHRGLAYLSVCCFSLVVMAWYGVNFVLGAGLHSYGFGGGGQGYVYSAVALQVLFASAAVLRPTWAGGDVPSLETAQHNDVSFDAARPVERV